MQNRYVGDIGDFSKYYLLRELSQSGFKIGLNWYFTEPTEKELKYNGGDGKHTDYLIYDKYNIRNADPELFDHLRTLVVKDKRIISSVAELGILPHINNFFAEPVELRNERENWFNRSLATLKYCDVVFTDPDNGIIPKSVSPNGIKAAKYLLPDEIKRYYIEEKKSLIIYQHTNRSGKLAQQITSKIDEIEKPLSIQNKNLVQVIYTGLGTSRFYIVVIQPSHSVVINNIINKTLQKCSGLKLLGLFNRITSKIDF